MQDKGNPRGGEECEYTVCRESKLWDEDLFSDSESDEENILGAPTDYGDLEVEGTGRHAKRGKGEKEQIASDDSDEELYVNSKAEYEDMGIVAGEKADKLFRPGGEDASVSGEKALAKDRKKQIGELSRRQKIFDATREVNRVPTNRNMTVSDPLGFEIPGQKWFIWNPTHTNIRPFSMEAGFRICGVFGKQLSCIKHGQKVMQDQRLTVAFSHRSMWNIVVRDVDRIQDEDYKRNKIKLLLDLHSKDREKSDKEFEEKIQSARSEGEKAATKPSKAKSSRERKASERQKVRWGAIKSHRRKVIEQAKQENPNIEDDFVFPRQLEVRGQTHAAVIILDDLTETSPEKKEPIWKFLGAFKDEDACRDWITSVAKDVITDFHIDCVTMYEFLFPFDVSKHKDKIREEYRDPELNNVMNRRKTEKNKVKSFEQWCARNDMVMPVTEVTSDGSVKAVDMRGKAMKDPEQYTKPMEVKAKDANPEDFGFTTNKTTTAKQGQVPKNRRRREARRRAAESVLDESQTLIPSAKQGGK